MAGKPGRSGRPSKHTAELAAAICRRLSEGESLRAICRDEGMPSEVTVRSWALGNVNGFSAQYAQARALGYERWAEEVVEIADDGTGDTWTDDEGREHVNSDHIQRSRLRVDTRKWLLSKLLPKVYGDKQELTGAGGGPLVVKVVRFSDVESDPTG